MVGEREPVGMPFTREEVGKLGNTRDVADGMISS